MVRSGSRGLRDSGWNRGREQELYSIPRAGLALETALSTRRAEFPRRAPRPQSRHAAFGDGAASVFGYYVAPWLAPVRRRYQTGNRPVIRLLDWITAKTWPLAILDEQCRWLEEGSAASRITLGCAVAAVLATLLSFGWAPYRLQSITWLPVFAGHGMAVLVAASFLVGATLLPAVLGRVLPVLLRLYVLLNLCAVAVLLGYGIWLLCAPLRM